MALIRAGSDTNNEVRSSALASLGKLGAPPSEALFDLLRSSNEWTRVNARAALLGPAASQRSGITQLLTNAISGTVDERVMAIRALAALNARRKDVVERFQGMTADEREDPRVREASEQALKRFEQK
jgi:HEAT repeat protein